MRRIVITEWALASYTELRGTYFTDKDYEITLRPDVLRLRDFPDDPKFDLGRFWSPASAGPNQVVPGGFKMKWRNLGPSRVQLRLYVGLIDDTAFLCHAKVKKSSAIDRIAAAQLASRLQAIREGRHTERGEL